MKKLITICLVMLLAINALPVQAAVNGQALGTASPPSTLGTYTMTGFPADPQAEFTDVTSVASPLGGTVDFSPALNHRIVGSGWATWSNGYTGDVYYNTVSMSATLTLPANTGAFYLYAEPQSFDTFQITATAQDGTFVTQMVVGDSGACGYGFWGTGGSLISSIQIDNEDPTGFAVGELGIANVPEPATICLLGLGAMSLIRRKK